MSCEDPVLAEIRRVLNLPNPDPTLADDQLINTVTTNNQASLLTSTSTTLVSANTKRRFLSIVNNSGTTIWLDMSGGTAAATDVELPAGHVLNLEPNSLGEMFTGAITGFQSSGSTVVASVMELSRA